MAENLNTEQEVKVYCDRGGDRLDNKSIQLVPPFVRAFLDSRKAKNGDISLWVTLKNYLKEDFFDEFRKWLDYENIKLYQDKIPEGERDDEIKETNKTEGMEVSNNQ